MAESIVIRPMNVYVNAEGDVYDEIPEGEEDKFEPHRLEIDDVINIFIKTTPDIDIIDTDYAISEGEKGIREESAIIYYEKRAYRTFPWNYLDLS